MTSTTAGPPFKRAPDERVVRYAGMFCGEGEIHPSDLRPGSYKAEQSKVFLTSKRLVATRGPLVYKGGPLVWLVRWLQGRMILFAASLDSVAVVEAGTAKTRHLVVWTADGRRLSFRPTHPLIKADLWVSAIVAGVARARPGVPVVVEGRSTFFGSADQT